MFETLMVLPRKKWDGLSFASNHFQTVFLHLQIFKVIETNTFSVQGPWVQVWVCGQTLGYISWVRKELAGGNKVRGVIVASEFADRLRYAADAVGSISLI